MKHPLWLGVDRSSVLVYDAQEQSSVGAGRVRVWNSYTKRHETHSAAQLRARIVPFFQYMTTQEPGLTTTELIQAAHVICNLYAKLHAGTCYNDECEAHEHDAIAQEQARLEIMQDQAWHDAEYESLAAPDAWITSACHAA